MDVYEEEESVSSELVDRLSELPHSLILRILSLLPMRDVVSTTLLSNGWNNLWTTLPCLNFCETINQDLGIEKVRNFINRALLRWKGPKILKFDINIRPYFDTSLASDIDLWVHFALVNEVEELSIDLMNVDDKSNLDDKMEDVYRAPQLLNSCSSIKKLSLVGCNLRIPGFPVWNQLTSLRIDGFHLSKRLINRILLGSPQLEDFELGLLESSQNLNIRSTSLKKLKIVKCFVYRYYIDDDEDGDIPHGGVLRICCPKLETLELSGVPFRDCLLTHVSSLTDATLGFICERLLDIMLGRELLGETLRRMLPTIQHVERLGLSIRSAKELGASHKKAMLSPLPNVKFLKLVSPSIRLGEVQFRDAMNLLGIFPNLKMLVIEDDLDFISYFKDPQPINLDLSKSFLMQLKTVHINSPLINSQIFQIIEFLLKYASTLETLVIQPERGRTYSHVTFSQAAKKLLSMPRSSPTAKVIFNTN